MLISYYLRADFALRDASGARALCARPHSPPLLSSRDVRELLALLARGLLRVCSWVAAGLLVGCCGFARGLLCPRCATRRGLRAL